MRLPFIQVEMEVIEQAAPDIAVLLNRSEAKVGWGLVKLFRWALGRCPEDVPPSRSAVVEGPDAAALIANAAGFSRKHAEAFVAACEKSRPAFLQRVEGGIRIRGLDRYDAAWEAQQAKHERARQAAEKRWHRETSTSEHGLSIVQASPKHEETDASAMLQHAQTQTQTQTQEVVVEEEKREDSSTAPPPPGPPPPTAPVPTTRAEAEGVANVDGKLFPVTPPGLWEMVQYLRGVRGYYREGRCPRDWAARVEAIVRKVGWQGLCDEELAFLEDKSIQAPGHPTAVLLKCWESREEANAALDEAFKGSA